jgi:hypothetical protein
MNCGFDFRRGEQPYRQVVARKRWTIKTIKKGQIGRFFSLPKEDLVDGTALAIIRVAKEPPPQR